MRRTRSDLSRKAVASGGADENAGRPVIQIPVASIRPEPGLGRRRSRSGHDDLCQSVAQFGVLTPITVRRADDGSDDYLLVKGQGRTLACKRLGLATVPAVIVDAGFSDAEKVQQFLVENVARLRMKPVDRALLIARARADGEETIDVARRFGVTAATVRRLEAQLDGATSAEIHALRSGELSLALQAVIARHAVAGDRADVLDILASHRVSAVELDSLLVAIGWARLTELGPEHRSSRLQLLAWCLRTLTEQPAGSVRTRLTTLAAVLPIHFGVLASATA